MVIPSPSKKNKAMSLLEVLLALAILAVAVLTLVGYTVTIHRSAREGKRQGIASYEARSALELLRQSKPDFEAALTATGYTDTKMEFLLDGETDSSQNEIGRKAAATFEVLGRAELVANDTYRLVVTVSWDDDGRAREVVLESRTLDPRV